MKRGSGTQCGIWFKEDLILFFFVADAIREMTAKSSERFWGFWLADLRAPASHSHEGRIDLRLHY